VSLQNVLTDGSAQKSSSLRGRYRRSDIRAAEVVVRLIDEVPEFSLKANLLPTRPSASNSPIKTATTIDCRSPIGSGTAFPTSWWIAAKSTSSRARGLRRLQWRDLDAAGLLMMSSSVTSAGLELRISIRPKSRIHSNLVADVANNGQIVRIAEKRPILKSSLPRCSLSSSATQRPTQNDRRATAEGTDVSAYIKLGNTLRLRCGRMAAQLLKGLE